MKGYIKIQNGVEIYEGDILACGENNFVNMVVFYDDGRAMFSRKYIGRENDSFPFIGESERKYLQVIGNIHENAELLKNENKV